MILVTVRSVRRKLAEKSGKKITECASGAMVVMVLEVRNEELIIKGVKRKGVGVMRQTRLAALPSAS
jgi:hypothetical protein